MRGFRAAQTSTAWAMIMRRGFHVTCVGRDGDGVYEFAGTLFHDADALTRHVYDERHQRTRAML